MLINVEANDVDEVWQRLVIEGGLEPRLSLRLESFGQRHFIVADPGGVLVDVIPEIPAGTDYANAFVS